MNSAHASLRRARHPSSDLLSRPPAGARSPNRASTEPGPASAHPPAATRTRACPNAADPLTLIRPARRARAVLRSVGTADLAAAFVVAFAGSRRPSCRCRLSINSRLAMSVPPGGVAARSAASSTGPAASSQGSPRLREGWTGANLLKIPSNVMSKALIYGYGS
jgi:hypothetical protein